MSKRLLSASSAVGNMKERVKCPRCGAEYDMLDEAASEAIGGLCAACWYQTHIENRNITSEQTKLSSVSQHGELLLSSHEYSKQYPEEGGDVYRILQAGTCE
jgi:hypothetical protein